MARQDFSSTQPTQPPAFWLDPKLANSTRGRPTLPWHALPMNSVGMSQAEMRLLLTVVALLLLAMVLPSFTHAAHYHQFADQRTAMLVPHALNVWSNLPFFLFGVGGILAMQAISATHFSATQFNLARLFFLGLIMTAFCSTFYHLHPDDARLGVDRAGMVVAFAGLLGLAASRVSDRAGIALAGALLACGPLSVWIWLDTGNATPWGVVQFGGMLLVLALARVTRRDSVLPISWMAVILIYALAKVFEQADAAVFVFTGHWISGHTVKHVVASAAALPLLCALHRASRLKPSLESSPSDPCSGLALHR